MYHFQLLVRIANKKYLPCLENILSNYSGFDVPDTAIEAKEKLGYKYDEHLA